MGEGWLPGLIESHRRGSGKSSRYTRNLSTWRQTKHQGETTPGMAVSEREGPSVCGYGQRATESMAKVDWEERG